MTNLALWSIEWFFYKTHSTSSSANVRKLHNFRIMMRNNKSKQKGSEYPSRHKTYITLII